MSPEMSPLLRHSLEDSVAGACRKSSGACSPPRRSGVRLGSYEQVGERRTVGPNFLPVVIERFARERLWAVAQADGTCRQAAAGGAVRV